MKIFALLCSVAALLFGVSCERHQWEGKEGTAELYPAHEHGAHGVEHAEAGNQAKEEDHAKAEEAGHEGHGH